MNEEQAKRLMKENKVDNYAVDPKTGKVSIKRPSENPGPTNWPDANPTKQTTK